MPDDETTGDYALEHIIPRKRGGTDDLSNLCWSCQGCNNRKFTAIRAVAPLTGKTVNLYHPRRDDWNVHFRWSEDFLLIVGETPTGRATVKRLQLNRIGAVNLRRSLMATGKHPLK